VCEGEKTEPNYFTELKNYERISTVTVKVSGDCGSAPISVVEHALELYDSLQDQANPIEAVFCVFDRDEHKSYAKACAEIKRLAALGIPIEAVVSDPCFEYWLVLHFQYHRATYNRTGTRSPARNTYKHLGTFLKGYNKGAAGVYKTLKPLQGDAIENAKRAIIDAGATGQPNPSTYIHLLVERLLLCAE